MLSCCSLLLPRVLYCFWLFKSLLLSLWAVICMLITSLVCWLYTGTVGLVLFHIFFWCVCVCVCFPAMNLVDLKTVLLSLKTKMFLWCHFSQVDTLLDLIIWTILWCLFLFSEADANIRDYSGKKAKQYLKNSASSRAQRKQFLSYCQASGDLIITPRPNTGNSRGRGSGIVHLSMTETQLEDGWTLVWWMSYCTGPAAALPVS